MSTTQRTVCIARDCTKLINMSVLKAYGDYIQWNPSKPDTIGPEESVQIGNTLFLGLKSTQTWYLGKRVLFGEVSL